MICVHLTHKTLKRQMLLTALNGIYGNEEQWEMCEHQLPQEIIDQIDLCAFNANDWPLEARAYLYGFLDKPLSFGERETATMVYQRQRRIFHHVNPSFPRGNGENLIVCVLGLKSSGKSSVLHRLEQNGNHVIEIYREIDRLRQTGDSLVLSLPALPSLWRDEPVRIAIAGRGYDKSMPSVLYIGSLLRHAEIQYLSTLGQLLFVHVSASNSVRHERAFQRGRLIEQDHARLIELDAHRDGLWPHYETNDVGGLIAQATLVVENEVDPILNGSSIKSNTT